MEKLIRITNERPFSWKTRFSLFIGTFGIFWLFLEPLSAFSVQISILSKSGILGYTTLFLFSIIVTLVIEYYKKTRPLGKKVFIRFTIILTESGTRVPIETPQDMRIGHFIKLCFDFFENQKISDSNFSNPVREMYEWFLTVQREEKFIRLPSNSTFFEAEVIDGSICKFRGQIKEEFFEKALQIISSSKIVLSWKTEPKDLDLYLFIECGDKKYGIFHGNKGSFSKEPFCELNKDIQNGFGPEIIKIDHWIQGKYTCIVHNYSSKPSLSKSQATLEFSFDGSSKTFTCPTEGDGNWWKVFSYDRVSGHWKSINKIAEKPPSFLENRIGLPHRILNFNISQDNDS